MTVASTLAKARAISTTPVSVLAAWAGLSTAYLLAMLAAAWTAKPMDDAGPARRADAMPRLLVLVPAHDEELVIGAAVDALLNTDYPWDRRQVVVIADNCHDATATVARVGGADVWERHDPDRPGKGRAVGWALERAALGDHDAVVIVDADCTASRNLLAVLGNAIAGKAAAAQARYVPSNPTASTAAALRYAGFALINAVRPLGKSRLGLSAGLLGTGMALAVQTLDAVPWTAFSVTEDREYHLLLVEKGLKVHFVPQACVTSPMPATFTGGAPQQMRWDTGNALLARRFFRRLMVRGLRDRSLDSVHAALELLVPPQTVLWTGSVLTLMAGIILRARVPRAVGCFALAGQATYVVGGLRLVNAPAFVFRALTRAPSLASRRLGQGVRIVTGAGSRTWVRTDRAQ